MNDSSHTHFHTREIMTDLQYFLRGFIIQEKDQQARSHLFQSIRLCNVKKINLCYYIFCLFSLEDSPKIRDLICTALQTWLLIYNCLVATE